jgi:hypothetical protein
LYEHYLLELPACDLVKNVIGRLVNLDIVVAYMEYLSSSNILNSANGMNNTAGSYYLVDAKTRKEASLITRLRKAGAIILDQVNMSEWGKWTLSWRRSAQWLISNG